MEQLFDSSFVGIQEERSFRSLLLQDLFLLFFPKVCSCLGFNVQNRLFSSPPSSESLLLNFPCFSDLEEGK